MGRMGQREIASRHMGLSAMQARTEGRDSGAWIHGDRLWRGGRAKKKHGRHAPCFWEGLPKAKLNKSQRLRAPEIGMGCKAQNADGPGGPARLCNAADRPMSGCTRREGLVQRCPNPPAGRLTTQAARGCAGSIRSPGQQIIMPSEARCPHALRLHNPFHSGEFP